MGLNSFDDAVSAIAALQDSLSGALYRFVASRDQAVSRDEAAAALGVSRSLAATHLDRLAERGLVDVEFRRLSGRQGPGAGRPAKLYRRAQGEITVSVPARHYDLAADVLASALSKAADTGCDVTVALGQVARDRGAIWGQAAWQRAERHAGRSALAQATADVLAEQGYEPRMVDGGIALANCPFHRLVAEHTELVCAMNQALLQGMADTLPDAGMTARLDPSPGWCCVRLDLDPRLKEDLT